jgi:hypothetical protein
MCLFGFQRQDLVASFSNSFKRESFEKLFEIKPILLILVVFTGADVHSSTQVDSHLLIQKECGTPGEHMAVGLDSEY